MGFLDFFKSEKQTEEETLKKEKVIDEEFNKEWEKQKKEMKAIYQNIIMGDIAVLSRKFNQLVIEDDYGNFIFDRWYKEVEYYIDKKLDYQKPELEREVAILESIIVDLVSEYQEENLKNEANTFYDQNMSPNDYEYFCAKLLQSQGLDARVTQQSGDQGVDIIIYSENKPLVAIQCKMYSSPVGNKAVQEVYAAKQHIGAGIAVVVTNNTYTKSARELANTTHTLLLHHEDLKNFLDLFDESEE